ncbi:hypothetical protein [Agriterribacter sp.]|uniref:hypothetical protein n=1 Tax=Agriterribacter sp. TaxID=2821509 RepID=UPI002C435187|nr:hypothetical protein [Agriterribacter sp.]HTN08776.1 hypothetical protein [Agriterribacter sp.]
MYLKKKPQTTENGLPLFNYLFNEAYDITNPMDTVIEGKKFKYGYIKKSYKDRVPIRTERITFEYVITGEIKKSKYYQSFDSSL